MFELVFYSGKLKGRRLTLPVGKEIVIGREAGCQLMLNSNLISRRHCELKHTAEGIWVRDLDSQNGTYVNDVAIPAPTLLRAGDVLRVGASEFLVQASSPKSKVAPSPSPAAAKVSENEIVDWLASCETTAMVSETTISRTGPSGAASPGQRRFKSVKEEADDIIRRHLERTGSGGKPGSLHA